jgi:hypothetical protein
MRFLQATLVEPLSLAPKQLVTAFPDGKARLWHRRGACGRGQ